MILPALHRGFRRRQAGFTLIELVTVIVILGALAVFALPQLVDTTMWRLRAYGDELQSRMQAMQRLALVQRRPVIATLDTTGVSFGYVAGGTLANLPCPAAATPCIAEAGPRSITFNSGNTGRSLTSTGAALAVTVASGSYSRAFRIETETGLIHPLP